MRETIAKHRAGDEVHVKLVIAKDDQNRMLFHGHITGSRLYKDEFFPERVLYDLLVQQAGGPDIEIKNYPECLIFTDWADQLDVEVDILGEEQRIVNTMEAMLYTEP